MRWLSLSLLAIPVVASAAPVTLQQQGRLLGSDGAPVEGLQTLVFEIWDAAEDGGSIHQESIQVLAQDGFYAVTLGAQGDLDSSEIDAAGVWLEVRAGEQSFGRSPVGFVPLAAVARDVRGGTADVSEVRVNNSVVIASDRSVTASALNVGGSATVGPLTADYLRIGDQIAIGGNRQVQATSITADSVSIGGVPVVAGEIDLPSSFHHIVARATILGSAHTRGVDPRTVQGSSSCPSGTTLVNWGALGGQQFWGNTTHWYANCSKSGNGVTASLYTQWGYGGHYMECFGLCVDN